MKDTKAEDRMALCTNDCREYRDGKGCRLLINNGLKSWESPYCPIGNWMPTTKKENTIDAPGSPARAAYKEDLRARGISFHEANGTIVVDKVPAAEMRVMKFFAKGQVMNIPGIDVLREQYFKEVDAIDDDCPSCEKGKIMRRYMPKVRALINASDKLAKTTG